MKRISGLTVRTSRHLRRTFVACAAIGAVGAPAASAAPPTLGAGQLVPNLTRVYQGADRSMLYVRAVGTKVVGFSEDPTRKTAFVYEGTRVGSSITGRYFDVAKGGREDAGPLNLTATQVGATLTRSGGEDVGPETWTAVNPAAVGHAKESEASFQSTLASDLDGAFEGLDGSRAYVRETAAVVVWVAERFTSPAATRPAYATVVLAKRGPNGNLTGTFFDVPKGTETLRTGAAVAQVAAKPRRITQQLYEAQSPLVPVRATTYSADYAIDYDRFAQGIEDNLGPFVVGYGYAITANQQLMRADGGGSRRIPQQGNGVTDALPYSEHTVGSIASATKTVTLVTVARALAARGISLDAPVDPYIPKTWTRGPGMKTVTFRELLSHKAAPSANGCAGACIAVPVGLFKPANCSDNGHQCLRDAIAGGMTAPAGYDNIHYSVFRLILPFVTKKAEMEQLFANETDEATIADTYSLAFQDEIRATMKAAGVNADFTFPAGYTDVAYRYTWGTPPTNEISPSNLPEDTYLTAGSGGLKVTPIQYAWFLSRLENGALLSRSLLTQIKQMGFGQTSWRNGKDDIGPLYGKDGATTGMGSYGMVFPGDVQAFIYHNSSGNDDMPNRSSIVRNAWQAALL